MAFDPSGTKVVLFGGLGTAPQLKGDTWLWDGSNWQLQAPAATPSPRNAPAMAFDFTSGATILFGGIIDAAGNGSAQTWSWNGANWTQLFPAASPSARGAASLVWDEGFGRLRLFGGRTNPLVPTYSSETWTWDGATWVLETPASPPPALADPVFVYDANRFNAVLFSGNIIGTGDQNSTHLYSWPDWTHPAPASSPPVRQAAWGALFRSSDAVLVYGGLVPPTTALADLWEWRGSTWRNVTPSSGPSARGGAGAAVDALTQKPMLFGGFSAAGAFLGETWFLEHVATTFEVALGTGGVAPGIPSDRTAERLLQSALPELELGPGCRLELRSETAAGALRSGDKWGSVAAWVNSG